jgi:hypothetical protein
VAWRYRRSLRFPGGFKLNLSKSGVGYSWGFRGFRVGRDSRGRVSRTVSIPGTGIFNRQYVSGSKTQQQKVGTRNSGCGGCISTLFLVFLALLILGRLTETGNTIGLIVLAVVAVGVFVIWQFREPHVRQEEVAPKSYEALGQAVKAMFVDLSIPVKNELRKSRGASAYEDVFTMTFFNLICRFAALDGAIDAAEAKVFLDVFTVLHPRQYAGLSPADGIALLEGQQQRHPEALQEPIKESLLLNATQRAGEQLARGLKELMYSVALQVALADGPVSPVEQAELALLLDAAGTTAQRADTNPGVGEANRDATTAPPAEVVPFRPEPQVQRPIIGRC